ncbi:hypothetical protein KVY11_14540 [Acinetobacter sp. CWB-G5]|uniref:hypothetical protein n=1 Tax=Acinetobacter sp. CWB-G5 TaxID=2855444 RepID=UPI001C43EA9A|nr:hypothetical protein [Acinetobacter sp. CWB-G5]MBV7309882.1 hypothetical protein [Acinetobacter sp. CWB-G5]
MMFEKYDAYKDSGVEWIGHIPRHWEIEKAKWIFLKADRPIRPNDGIVTCFRDGQVTLRSNRRTDGFTNALKEHGYQGIRKGDLVIHAMDAFAGAIGVSDSDGKSTPVYSACIPRIKNRINVHYYAYYLRNLALAGFIESLAKGIRERSTDFRFADFAELLLPFPEIEDQERIVAFLDQKTSEIDQAIVIKEQQIALLNERKQIVIQKAVTQGLDSNVPMKDSGVEWIGEIPEHWKILKFKRACQFIYDGTHGSYPRVEQGYRLLSVRNIIDNEFVFREDDSCVSQKYFKEISSKFLICNDDIQLAIVGGTLGKAAIVKNLEEDIVTQRSLATLRTQLKVLNPNFLLSFIRSPKYQNFLWANAGFSAQPGVYLNTIQNSYLCMPCLKEQTLITEYIETETIKFSYLIGNIKDQIEKLKEYKTTLINDAVTGKIKVA